ncbi:hypothetical protein ACN4EG_06940 [Alkalinema pantanalense CENA528]|uniref:hypothetical protein n=1 Tax=Alkalinema pantanalense TaxID=1620705 RepID=UPI003D6DE9F0
MVVAAEMSKSLQSGRSIVQVSMLSVLLSFLTIGCGSPVGSSGQSSAQGNLSSYSSNPSDSKNPNGTSQIPATSQKGQESTEATNSAEANPESSTKAAKMVAQAGSSQSTKATIDDFIPAGWQLSQQISGDLNGDRRSDAVLKLSKDGQFDLIVLLATSSGWQQLAHAPNLLFCGGCAGPLGTNQGGHIRIEIEEDVLLVKQIAGSRGAVEIVHRFWIDRPSGQLVLIGEDVNPYDRANGNEIRDSRNFLTGKRIVEEYRGNPDGGGKQLIRTQNLAVSRQLQPIDAIDIEQVRSSAPELPAD